MTSTQKEAIKLMRAEGLSYGIVSERTGIGYEAVKSFCRRNGLTGFGSEILKGNNRDEKYVFCKNCGKRLVQQKNLKRRVFCCDECRVKWWSTHPEMINKKAVYHFVCIHCGKPFSAYGNSGRKYCSHECYIEERFGRNEDTQL